jgi:sialate O-acetylesterase
MKQGDIPFYYAQIAPYEYAVNANSTTPIYNSAYIREAQLNASKTIPNSGLAVLLDIGEEKSIHPSNKEVGGKRLAYLALSNAYGIKGIEAESPVFDSLFVKGDIATITFKSANGITSFGKPLTLFEIAGEDKKFYPAKAILSDGKINLSADEVKSPIAVRYAFKNFVVGDLFGIEGLPVSSFRTDNW